MGSSRIALSYPIDTFGELAISLVFITNATDEEVAEISACIEHHIESLLPEFIPAVEGISPREEGETDVLFIYRAQVDEVDFTTSFTLKLSGIELSYSVSRQLIDQTYESFVDHALRHLLDPHKEQLKEEVANNLDNTTFQLMCQVNQTSPKDALLMSMSGCKIAVGYVEAMDIPPISDSITELLQTAKVKLTENGAVVHVGNNDAPTGLYL